ncbi:MAG: NifU N-terminal domain-containing protein [Sumerlaeia bacterium]
MPQVTAIEPTPNENAMKYTVSPPIQDRGRGSFKDAHKDQHPLAAAVFKVPGVIQVFLLNDFVTVTKDPAAEWGNIQDAARAAIESVGDV